MIHWWFLHFPKLKVKLTDIDSYEGKTVPAYYLWHPSDHYGASLTGSLGPDGNSQAGAFIQIQETMQYLKYGWKYPVNNQLKIYYCESDGWAMGKELPILGKMMMLRIHYKDVVEGNKILGVHYHYEIVIGASGNSLVSRLVNKKVGSHFSTEFFEAWHLHNAIEVGTFENFLPALYAQKENLSGLEYSKCMNPIKEDDSSQSGYDRGLFEERVQGYRKAANVHDYQAWNRPAFLD